MIQSLDRSIAGLPNHLTPWVPILCYHRVCPKEEIGVDSKSLCVSPSQFESQMFLLKLLRYQTISLQDLAAVLCGRKNLNPRSVVITFDDGYEDNYFYAFPILRKHGMSATIFLVTDLIGKKNSWDSGTVPLLRESQIEEMHSYGLHFGSHTATHKDLTVLSPSPTLSPSNSPLSPFSKGGGKGIKVEGDSVDLKEELIRSKEKIFDLTRRLEIPFCYPYARWNAEAIKLVRDAGYFCAMAGSDGIGQDPEELFSLHRIQIFPSNNLFDFWRKIQSWYPRWLRVQQEKLNHSKD